MRSRRTVAAVFLLLATTAGAGAGFAPGGVSAARAADSVPVDMRVDRLEKEMRAVQRKVFPGGTPVEPEITAAAPAAASAVPSSTPVTDLMARVTSLETQMASLTGQIEQNGFRLKQVEDRLKRLEAEQATAPSAAVVGDTATAEAAPRPIAAPKPAAPAPRAPSEARKTAVAAIERPKTGDAANDSYTYGYRLWEAKFYPEAQTQLKTTVEQYGKTSVASRARNMLGRAYLDEGKPALASVAFYENYQKNPEGDRAAQSLAYLGEALIQLKKPADACKVYKELESSYPNALTASLKAMVEKGRVRAKCGA